MWNFVPATTLCLCAAVAGVHYMDVQQRANDGTAAQNPSSRANGFSRDQAEIRIESLGYTNVTGLKKDAAGLWRADAMLDGKNFHVALNYQGQVN